jgi:release factor glutamine methyltransferase
MLALRVSGRPLEHILGWADFAGIRVTVADGVFVPRRRTGFLVDQAVALAAPRAVVVDLCCGSGAVGAAMLARLPGLVLSAADIDPAAVACARRNLAAGAVFEGDLFVPLPASLRSRVEVIVANAPYVPTDAIGMMPPEARLYEAAVALDGGSDGLDIHRRIAVDAPRWLAPGGHLLIETSTGQAAGTAALFRASGLRTRVARSAAYEATVVIGTLAR